MAESESEFHRRAERFLESVFEQLEAQDVDGLLEVDLEEGVLTIALEDGRQFLLNRHAASRELWFSSPLSGGLHFSPAEEGDDWQLADGRRLSVLLTEELGTASGLRLTIKG